MARPPDTPRAPRRLLAEVRGARMARPPDTPRAPRRLQPPSPRVREAPVTAARPCASSLTGDPDLTDEQDQPRQQTASELDRVPDVRDGLTRRERVVLWVLAETQRERSGRSVPTAQLYGRVVEHLPDMTVGELQRILQRFGGVRP